MAWRNNTGATRFNEKYYVQFGFPGSPDIICVLGGRFIGIECKSQKGKLNANQEKFKAELERSGGLYIVARSIDDVMNNQIFQKSKGFFIPTDKTCSFCKKEAVCVEESETSLYKTYTCACGGKTSVII